MKVDKNLIHLDVNDVATLLTEALIHRGLIKPSKDMHVGMRYLADVDGGTGTEVITFTGCDMILSKGETTGYESK